MICTCRRCGRKFQYDAIQTDPDMCGYCCNLDGEEFDAEAGRDVLAELNYIRSGQEKRNCGC